MKSNEIVLVNDKLDQTNYFTQMANLASGTGNNSFLNNSNGSRSSFRSSTSNSIVNNINNSNNRFNNNLNSNEITNKSSSALKFFNPPLIHSPQIPSVQTQTNTTTNNENNNFKSSLIDDVEFIDGVCSSNKDTTESEDNQDSAVYNFPWDVKLKSNPLLSNMQMTSSSTSSNNSPLPNVPQIPPPLPPQPPQPSSSSSQGSHISSSTSNNKQLDQQNSSNKTIIEQDETQYCAPWDLKIQEEMLKMMAQQQQQQQSKLPTINKSSNSSMEKVKNRTEEPSPNNINDTNNKNNVNTNGTKEDKKLNGSNKDSNINYPNCMRDDLNSIKSNKSINDLSSSCNSSHNSNILTNSSNITNNGLNSISSIAAAATTNTTTANNPNTNSTFQSTSSSTNTATTTTTTTNRSLANFDTSTSEYSPPWEHKQNIFLQSLAAGSANSNQKSSVPPQLQNNQSQIGSLSAASTLTNANNNNNINQQQTNSNPASALNSLFNQFSRTRLSTRSNTSSSSSTHSSTSSLSTNSPPSLAPPSIPPPPLPPSIPPPPPPTSSLQQIPPGQNISSSSILNNNTDQQTKNNIHRCIHQLVTNHHQQSQQQQQQNQQSLCQQSPRLSHRHLCQNSNPSNTSTSSLPANITTTNLLLTRATNNLNNNSNQPITTHFAIVPGTNIQNSCTNLGGTCCLTNNMLPLNNNSSMNVTSSSVSNGTSSSCSQNHSSLLNESNKFCSWGSNSSSNTSSFDTLASNFDEPKQLSRQNRGSNHHFAYPQHHFQTVPSNGQLITTTGEIQVALPVTALVFSQTSSLPSNLIPLNIQHQQNNQQISAPLVSPSLSHIQALERQIWYHGRITRKQAENLLNNKPVGSFLVRQSESGNCNDFSLSLVSGSGCVHMRICMKNGEFILGQCSQPFSSIVRMIEHYGKVEVPIKGAQHVRLLTPIPPSN